MTDRSLILTAPAKINLYLGVHTERDARGYHRVDSLMAAVGLADAVTVTPAQALTVQTVPASDFPMQKNTAYRAAIAMAERYGRDANVCVTIEKRIPLCAGLGGPSTDAAAVIVALAELWGIDRADPALDDIARGIGATCRSFCTRVPHSTSAGEMCWPLSILCFRRHLSYWSNRTRRAFQRLKRIDDLMRARCPRKNPMRLLLSYAPAMPRRHMRSFITIWASYPRRWSRGSRRFSTGCAHRREPLPWTCAVRVPARLPFVIPSLQQPILRELPSKMAGGPARLSLFPTRFKSTRQRNKNFSSTRRKSLLL